MLDQSETLHLRGLLRSLREAAERDIGPVSYAGASIFEDDHTALDAPAWGVSIAFKPVRVDRETIRTPTAIAARAGDLGAALDLARAMIAERAPAPQPARLITGEPDCPYNGQAEVGASQSIKHQGA